MDTEELELSDLKLTVHYNGEKILVGDTYLRLQLRGLNLFEVKKPTFVVFTNHTEKENQILVSDPRIHIATRKVKHRVTTNVRTRRSLTDIEMVRYLKFDKNYKSYGYGNNAISGKNEFTVVLDFSTTDNTAKGSSYYYQIPWLIGCRSDGNTGGFGLGTDKGNLYVWSGLGKGGNI